MEVIKMEVEEALKPVAREVEDGQPFLIYNFGMGLKTPHKVGAFAKTLTAMFDVSVFLIASSDCITFFGCSVPRSKFCHFTALRWAREACTDIEGGCSGSTDGCHAQGSFRDAFVGDKVERNARRFAEIRTNPSIIQKD